MLAGYQRRVFVWLGILALYAITWIGGFTDLRREL